MINISGEVDASKDLPTKLKRMAETHSMLTNLPGTSGFNQEEASKILEAYGVKYTPKTLEVMRVTSSRGPRFEKIGGRVVYRLDDLRRFAGVTA